MLLYLPFTEKYFDMKKVQCKEGLDIYKKFLTRMTRISEFLKVAEVRFSCVVLEARYFIKRALCNIFVLLASQQVGIDRGDIPDLSQVRQHFYSDFNTCTLSALLMILSIF